MTASPVVLVTGAARGLGRAIALAFAKKSYAIGVNYLQNESEASVTAAQIEKKGGKAFLLKADVQSSADVSRMIRQIVDIGGRLDVLVNNAGQVRNRALFKMTDEEWRDVLSVNLDGPFYCTRAALPVMRKQQSGVIINITSYAAGKGIRGAANYAVAKAGVITLTKNIALEEGEYNIRANAIMPGFHVTDMNRDVWQRFEKEIRAQHLLKDLPDLDEMADFVVTVAELKSITGQVFAFESRLS